MPWQRLKDKKLPYVWTYAGGREGSRRLGASGRLLHVRLAPLALDLFRLFVTSNPDDQAKVRSCYAFSRTVRLNAFLSMADEDPGFECTVPLAEPGLGSTLSSRRLVNQEK